MGIKIGDDNKIINSKIENKESYNEKNKTDKGLFERFILPIVIAIISGLILWLLGIN